MYAAIIIIADSGTSCCDVRSSPVPGLSINKSLPLPLRIVGKFFKLGHVLSK